mmetsp:Transcript_21333/g.45306  ORF Transcript_21333/g.45306 Transcript_21333/m.45306 type:complete len:81 (+) Transcript_21333:731-973(+)
MLGAQWQRCLGQESKINKRMSKWRTKSTWRSYATSSTATSKAGVASCKECLGVFSLWASHVVSFPDYTGLLTLARAFNRR